VTNLDFISIPISLTTSTSAASATTSISNAIGVFIKFLFFLHIAEVLEKYTVLIRPTEFHDTYNMTNGKIRICNTQYALNFVH
jgi:hypothetical protein